MSERTILVVDDEPDLLELIVLELEYSGFKAIAVNGGYAAIKKLQEESCIDLVLTDMRMPDGSGMELLESMESSQSPIPRIVMSGYSDYTKEEVLAKGANAVFHKPADMDHVIAKINELLENQRLKRES